MKSDSLVGRLTKYNLEYILIGLYHRTLLAILFQILWKEIVRVRHTVFGSLGREILTC